MAFDYSLIEEELFTSRFASMNVSQMKTILAAVFLSQYEEEGYPGDYEAGRRLGLTAKKMSNLRVQANLFLDTPERTRDRARRVLCSAFERGAIEYGKSTNRIIIQMDDAVALNHFAGKMNDEGVVRDVDFNNGNISVSPKKLESFLRVVYSEEEMDRISQAIEEAVSSCDELGQDKESSAFKKLEKYLPLAKDAIEVLEGVFSVFPGVV